MFIVSMREAGGGAVLAGRLEGRRTLFRLLERLADRSNDELCVLDFAGVSLATASYLGEAVLRAREHLNVGSTKVSLIAANLEESVEEELDYLLTRAREALVGAQLQDGKLSRARLLGELDPALSETLELLLDAGELSAVELHAKHASNRKIGPTAWNNRLSALASMGLVREKAVGRSKRYRPVVEF